MRKPETRMKLGQIGAALAILAWFALPRPTAPCCIEPAAQAATSSACCVASQTGDQGNASQPNPTHPPTGSDGRGDCHGCPAACCGKIIPIPDAAEPLLSTLRPQFIRPPSASWIDLLATGGVFHPPRC
jgi:hypothetical protein